jgi:hypothetical protein
MPFTGWLITYPFFFVPLFLLGFVPPESLKVLEKFRISERKVQIIAMIG